MNFSQLMSLASGHVEARIVQCAVRLDIFDVFKDTSAPAEPVARQLGLEPAATELLLNALAALKLLIKQNQSFSLAPIARRYLLPNSPQYVGGMILFEDSLWQCWEKLPEAIRSGKPVRPPDMYQEDPKETEIFINAMDSLVKARGDAEIVANSLDWNEINELLDIGAGPATYPIELCRRFPRLHATVLDLPATLKITERYVRDAGLGDRIRLLAGDYRNDPIPSTYEVVLMSNIIHGENYEKNQLLIGKLAKNLKPSGRLVIKDHILNETRAEPAIGAIFSLLMLLTTDGGRCYSFGEIQRWMELAGIGRVRQIDLPPPLTSSLVIGTK
jgi:SAM-dependent methyltransferase